jgi:hypothetical protein
MSRSTLKRLVFIALLGLAACSPSADTSIAAEAAPLDPTGWLLASGKVPTNAELAALAATCQDRGGAIDSCLANLGVKRAP